MLHPEKTRLNVPPNPRPRFCGSRFLILLLLAAFVPAGLPGCKSREEREDKKPRKPRRVRDPVEQKVFYDGWWPERW